MELFVALLPVDDAAAPAAAPSDAADHAAAPSDAADHVANDTAAPSYADDTADETFALSDAAGTAALAVLVYAPHELLVDPFELAARHAFCAHGPLLAPPPPTSAQPRSRRRAARCVRPHRRALNARPAALRGASDRTAAL